MLIKCKYCGKAFNRSPSYNAKYCSKECFLNFLKKRSKKIKRICKNCGNPFEIFPSTISRGNKMGYEPKFCSWECRTQKNTGENNPHWKNAKTIFICKICGKEFIGWKYRNRKCCSRQCTGLSAVLSLKKNWTRFNAIELKIKKELEYQGINFLSHTPIEGISVVDFYIPEYRIIIQCDGDYWHKLKDHKIRDIKQDFLYHFKGYKVFRFWEKDIHKSTTKCVNKIKKYLERFK